MVEILNTPRTIPDFARISTPAKIGERVSRSVGISVARVMAFPSCGTQCSKDIAVLTANIFWRMDLNRTGTFTTGACFGMLNSTATLI